VADIFGKLFRLKDVEPPELKKIVKSIPKVHREKVIEAIQVFTESEIPQTVERISVFSGEHYNGYVDITPLGQVSDVFLKPPLWMKPPHYYLTCKKQFNPEKILRPETKEVIDCVPYIHVESEVGVCAQYAVRVALMNLLQKVPTVPELTFWATRKALRGGINRSQRDGWSAEEITEIMSEAIKREGFSAFRYSSFKCPQCNEQMPNIKCIKCGKEVSLSLKPTKENIYAYIESGIPVLLGIERVGDLPWWDENDEGAHALVGIGHTLSEKGMVDGLIVHDVSTYPYMILREPLINGKKLEDVIVEAIIPVYHEIIVHYPWARELALELMDLKKGQSYRPQLIEANKIKKWLAEGEQREHFIEYSINEKVKDDFSKAHMDRYVWLFEIKHELGNGTRNYVGDIIISAERPEVLGFNLPLKRKYGYVDENEEKIIEDY